MTNYTTNQQAVIEAIKDTNAVKMFFNGDNSKVYTMVTGCNGAAIKSLVKSGVIEAANHPIYKQMYRLVK